MRIEERPDQLGPGPDPVAAVVARMERVSAGLPRRDGVRAFNQMYLTTTRHVAAAIRGARLADPAFMARLDVVFANAGVLRNQKVTELSLDDFHIVMNVNLLGPALVASSRSKRG